MSTSPVVAICRPILNTIHPKCERSLRYLEKVGSPTHFFEVTNVTPHAAARNHLTADALLAPEVTHLLWIDADMTFPPDALRRLFAHGVPIVGGLCHDRRPPYKPILARLIDASWGADPGALGWVYDYPRDQLVPVDATGGAFLLVRRDVFEVIREREIGRQLEQDMNRNLVGSCNQAAAHLIELRASYKGWWQDGVDNEDISFCERARRAGFSLYVDTSLEIGHIGEVEVDSSFAKRNRAFEYSQWTPPQQTLLEQLAQRTLGEAPPLDGRPIASIVITYYDEEPEIFACAVRSALAQTVPCEVIVIDDGSKAPAAEVLDAMLASEELGRLTIIRQENRGCTKALNTGIAAMTTDWFCWLMDDDYFDPHKVEYQLAGLLCAKAKCGYTSYNLRADRRNLIGHPYFLTWRSLEEQNKLLFRNCCIFGSTVMVHRSIFEEVGTFDPSFRYANDWEMWCRIGKSHLWHGSEDRLTTRREFENVTAMLRSGRLPAESKLALEEDERIRAMYPAP